MKKIGNLQIPDEELAWIKAALDRSLLRFPELESFDERESFDDDELRGFIIFWDGIFVRWLRRMYNPVGVEVEHEPENQANPIIFRSLPEHFLRLPGQNVKLPNPLGPYEIRYDQLRDIVDTHGREGLVNDYLEKRLSQLSDASD